MKLMTICLYAMKVSVLNFCIQVYNRLQKINICMSHQTVVRLIDQLGMDHDTDVKEWQSQLEQTLTRNLTQVYIYMKLKIFNT